MKWPDLDQKFGVVLAVEVLVTLKQHIAVERSIELLGYSAESVPGGGVTLGNAGMEKADAVLMTLDQSGEHSGGEAAATHFGRNSNLPDKQGVRLFRQSVAGDKSHHFSIELCQYCGVRKVITLQNITIK